MKKLVLACLLAACAAGSARASIICVAPTSTTAGSIQITAPISFTINTNSTAYAFDLSGWVTSDGSLTASNVTPNLAFSLNGTAGSSGSSLYDNFVNTTGSVGPNDGLLALGSTFAVTAGNTVTLAAGTYALAAASGFNPKCTQTFTGSIFIFDTNANRISNIVSAVPEPSTWAMMGVGVAGLGVVTLRRRMRAA